MRIGILMGGASREREISFAGGRTVFDNLNKDLFTAVPIFVDGFNRLTLLNWPYLYKGSIRDFYPPPGQLPASLRGFQVYDNQVFTPDSPEHLAARQALGTPINYDDLPRHIDVAFLCLHGNFGEDGTVQGLLSLLGIPFTGSGLYGSAVGIDKLRQRELLDFYEFANSPSLKLRASQTSDTAQVLATVRTEVGFPCVVKHPTQGSSIGVQIVADEAQLPDALRAVQFRQTVDLAAFRAQSPDAQRADVQLWCDFRSSVGLPVYVHSSGQEPKLYTRPDELWQYLLDTKADSVELQGADAPSDLLIEGFVDGKEFSVIVVEDHNGQPLALPPTQIVKKQDLFDYRSKYLPGLSRKVTPMDAPAEVLERICQRAEQLMTDLGFDVYARIDGIVRTDGQVYFNDPNTTSGMLPSSFFFHQAAEVGFSPADFLTYIIHTSIRRRLAQGTVPPHRHGFYQTFLQQTDTQTGSTVAHKKRVGVILGGYSTERHISVESGRNIFEKLNSSTDYAPSPLFLIDNRLLPRPLQEALATETPHVPFSLFQVPIKTLLKDNADDIAARIVLHAEQAETGKPQAHPLLERIYERAEILRQRYARVRQPDIQHIPWDELSQHIDFAFIALHGRPGEDGQLQAVLERLHIPYNGSGVAAAATAIDKYRTNELLAAAGFAVASHQLVRREEYELDPERTLAAVEARIPYPIIAKPVDEGCSSAVLKLRNRADLDAYARLTFRTLGEHLPDAWQHLGLGPNDEMPAKDTFLVEALLAPAGPDETFMEITVGLLTHHHADGYPCYEIFTPSETLALGGILTLEEKFLAGEGQNITPARLHPDTETATQLAAYVRQQIEGVARAVGIVGYARIDAFLRYTDPAHPTLYIIEINTLPGMTPATCIFHQTALSGYTPYEFIHRIIRYGEARLTQA